MDLPEDFGSHCLLALAHGLHVILIKRHLEQIPVCVGREHPEQTPQRARTDTATTSGASAQCSANSHAAF